MLQRKEAANSHACSFTGDSSNEWPSQPDTMASEWTLIFCFVGHHGIGISRPAEALVGKILVKIIFLECG